MIQHKVEDPLSDGLLSGRFEHFIDVLIDVEITTDEEGKETKDIVLYRKDEGKETDTEKELEVLAPA